MASRTDPAGRSTASAAIVSAPLIIGAIRGKHEESTHLVHAVVARDDGSLAAVHGDSGRKTFPRSAVKAIQALVLVESGAADAFGFTPAELALACSSHVGSPLHAETARGMLAKAGLDASALECGTHWPSDDACARALAGSAEPSALHNNCSGKHAGFLAAARHLGIPTEGYVAADHPLQARVTEALAEVTGVRLSSADRATDGCSIPTYALPLGNLATAFARIGTGVGLPGARAEAFARLRAAVAAHPLLLAGQGRFDTRLTETCGARVFVKSGAEGVLCASVPSAGIGIAIKAEDGALRAAEVAMAEMLLRHLPSPTPEERALLDDLHAPALTNWNGTRVGFLAMKVPGPA